MITRMAWAAAVTLAVAGCGSDTRHPATFRMTGEHGVGPVVRTPDVASARSAHDEQTGEPIVLITFTRAGSARCHALMRAVAHAGAKAGRPFHIAIRVDGRVVARPYIDYHRLPEGVSCNQGVEITGLPSPTAATALVTKLRGR